MKTKELIDALAADVTVVTPLWNRNAIILIFSGVVMSVLIFSVFLGTRPDMTSAISDPHVIFKFIFAGAVILFAGLVASAVLRPDQNFALHWRWLGLPFIALLFGVIGQMITSPADVWWSGMMGRYPDACLKNIPFLASGPLAGLMLMSRRGAPSNPALAGLLIGALSGGFGAFLYALHCPDDSALFVAAWYSLAILITSAVGAAIGTHVLRW